MTNHKNIAGNELLCWFATSVDDRGECILVGSAVEFYGICVVFYVISAEMLISQVYC